MNNISVIVLKEALEYDPLTGVFNWKSVASRKVKRGDKAGTRSHKGYIQIVFCGKRFRAHRVAFALQTGEWPVKQVDHIDGNRSNNAWNNLRLVSPSENQRNRKLNHNSISKVKGVRRVGGTWRATIRVNGEIFSRSFPTPRRAEIYLKALREELHGEFANHG